MKYLKQNKFFTIQEMLQENPGFLLDFDQFKRTGLHWASSAGFIEIIDLLLKSDEIRLNSKDIDGKTPLFLAAKKGFLSIVKKLLYRGASPWSSKGSYYKEGDLDVKVYQEIRKARKIEIMMALAKEKRRKKEIWIEESEIFLL